jgi:PAS domain S-box-containing protein
MGAGKGRRILLVEDEAIAAGEERLRLEEYGYEVLLAVSGREAIEIYARDEGIDLVLVDIDLGDGNDGAETAKAIFEEREIPILFLSRVADMGSGMAALDASIKMALRLFEANRAIASNRMFRAVLDAMPQYICWKDRSSVFRGCNKNHSDLFGLPSTEAIVGKTDHDLHMPDEAEKYIADDKEVMDTDRPRYRILERAFFPGKGVRWHETNKVPLRDSGGEVDGIMIAYTDITQQRETEIALSQEQYYLQTLMDTSPDHIYFKDRESRFIRASKSMCHVLHREDLSEILGKTDFDFFSTEHAQKAFEDEQEIIRTGEPLMKEEKETSIGHPDAWVYSVKMPLKDKEGNIVGTFGISRDITETKKIQEALRESNERWHGIIERISDYIYTSYLVDGTIVETVHGQACVAVTGYTTEEFEADPYLWFNMIYPDDRTRVQEHTTALVSDACANSIEHRILRKDGALRWIRNTPVLHRDPSGKLFSYDGIIFDITERKMAEDEVQKLLEEKELILKEVHHRIKNNMTTVSSLLNLQASTLKESNAVKAIRDAVGRVQSMMVLYDNLYTSPGFLSTNLSRYLSSLVEQIMGMFSGGVPVRVAMDMEEVVLSTKLLPSLGIMINEILTNTMKYAFKDRLEGSIALSARLRDGMVFMEISDDGVGLPESLDFESSTSFGLMLIKMLSDQLDGTIRLERGKGTKYSLEFKAK